MELSHRQNRGGLIMVWGAFTLLGILVAVLLTAVQNIQRLLKVIKGFLLFASIYR